MSYIDSVALVLEEPQQRNYQRWDLSLGRHIWPNNFVGQTHQEEVDYMKNWIGPRLEWLDQNIEKLVSNPPYDPTGISDDQLKISVFPNPFSESISIVSDTQFVRLKLLDLLGRKLFDDTIKPSTEYDFKLQSFPDGLYILELMMANGTIEQRKIIKN